MAPSIQLNIPPMHLPRAEKAAKVAAADVRKTEKSELWIELGRCLASVCSELGISLKEFAAKLGKDERQLARQMEGHERPQIEAVFAVPEYRAPLVLALARLTPGIEMFTELRVRRTA